MENKTIAVKNLIRNFDQGKKIIQVLRGINYEFQQKNTYSITGTSGSGKSTFLHLLGGLDTPTSGEVIISEKNIATLKQKQKEELLNQTLGFVFQFHYLINELTVLENITLVGEIKGMSKQKAAAHAQNLLESVGILDKANSYPDELSGGEQQRVSIVRAIFNKPQFLLADEPTGNLDAENAKAIVDLLLQCQSEWGMGIILCSHDKSVYERMETVLMLKDGTLQ
jgi:lipoprotein-releasing system ATP-binding protein